MKSRLARIVALLAAVHILGGHWFAMQTVAWVGMFAANTRLGDWGGALEKTFDGKHPCPLCAAVEEGTQKEKERRRNQWVDTIHTVNALTSPSIEIPSPVSSRLVYFSSSGRAESLCIQPPSPPPWRA